MHVPLPDLPAGLAATCSSLVHHALQGDADETYRIAVRELCSMLGAEDCSLFRVDPRTQELTLVATSDGDSVVTRKRMAISREGGLTGSLLLERAPVRLAGDDLRLRCPPGQTPTYLRDRLTQSLLAIPLIDSKGCPIGLLKSSNKSVPGDTPHVSGEFTATDEAVGRIVAGILTLHIEFDTAFTAIGDIVGALRVDAPTRGLAEKVVTHAMRFTRADAGELLLWDERSLDLKREYTTGDGAITLGDRAREVWEDGPRGSPVLDPSGSLLVELIDGRVRIGILHLRSRHADGFDARDAYIAELLTKYVSPFLRYATRRDMLRTELAEQPGSERPLQNVLDLILNGVREMMKFDSAVVYYADHVNRELRCRARIDPSGGSVVQAPRYRFDEGPAMVTRVLRDQCPYHSPDPTSDPNVSQTGVSYFRIRSSAAGIPLCHGGQCLGVLVVWNSTPPGPTADQLETLRLWAQPAAAYLAACLNGERLLKAWSQLAGVLKQTHAAFDLDQPRAMSAILEAIQAFPFDRVRLFTYDQGRRAFVPLDCLGMENRDRFLGKPILAATNAHAERTIATVEKAEGPVRTELYQGYDPDHETLEKPPGTVWAVAPLVLNETLLGQIVADNAITREPITEDARAYLDTIATLTVGILANRQSVQFLSLISLPTLFRWVAIDSTEVDVLKRLLVYLTCGESLGFNRAIYLEKHTSPDRLVYRLSIGSLTARSFQRVVGTIVGRKSLNDILAEAPQIYDADLDDTLKGFTIDLSAAANQYLIEGVSETDLPRLERPTYIRGGTSSRDAEEARSWIGELGRRIGPGAVLSAPLSKDDVTHGLVIVDRRWSGQPLGRLDHAALQAFVSLAAHILQQTKDRQTRIREQKTADWEMMAKVAAHKCQDPITAILNQVQNIRHLIPVASHPHEHRLLDSIYDSAMRADRFINDFRSLAGAQKISTSRVAMSPLLNSLNGPEYADIRWSISCPADLEVLGDNDLLITCFRELVSNAAYWMNHPRQEDSDRGVFRFHPRETKQIRIEARVLGMALTPKRLDPSLRYASIHFGDNGPGIPPPHEQNIFDIDYTGRKSEGGTGIGLFKIKLIVEGHRGMIVQYGRPGEGAWFAILLPLAEPLLPG